jgi:hypothetical protein
LNVSYARLTTVLVGPASIHGAVVGASVCGIKPLARQVFAGIERRGIEEEIGYGLAGSQHASGALWKTHQRGV